MSSHKLYAWYLAVILIWLSQASQSSAVWPWLNVLIFTNMLPRLSSAACCCHGSDLLTYTLSDGSCPNLFSADLKSTWFGPHGGWIDWLQWMLDGKVLENNQGPFMWWCRVSGAASRHWFSSWLDFLLQVPMFSNWPDNECSVLWLADAFRLWVYVSQQLHVPTITKCHISWHDTVSHYVVTSHPVMTLVQTSDWSPPTSQPSDWPPLTLPAGSWQLKLGEN